VSTARIYGLSVFVTVLTCLFFIGYALTFPDCNAAWLAHYDSLRHAAADPASSSLPDLQPLLPLSASDHRLLACARTRYGLHFAWVILELLFTYLFLQLGLARALSDLLQKRISNQTMHTAAFVLAYGAIMWALSFPLSCFSSFGLKHYYGLSEQSFTNWLIDTLKAFAVGSVIATLIWVSIYCALQRFKKTWPYVVFVVSIPVIFGMTFAAPLLIDPIFNKIVLMPASSLRTQISILASKAGIPAAPIFITDRSRQSKELNAYVTGIGNSARIVIYDTTIKTLHDDQVLSIVAHELGHYVLMHVYKACALGVGISLFLVPINLFVTPGLFKRTPAHWGISSLDDVAGLPFIVLLSSIITFWSEPLENGCTRFIESEADHYGYALIPDKTAFIKMFCMLSKENLSELSPPPMVKFWLFSHPPLGDRITAVQNDFH